jgi:DNA-binding response OmpR family regulator
MTKIAIIEDDSVIAQMYRMKFEADGFEVQVANNGQDGVALVQAFAPDMVLLDMQMPVMNGDEALKNIRSSDWGKQVPVMILTNFVKADLTPRQVAERVKAALGLAP